MTASDITTGLQTVTSTGAVTGSLDTSALSGDYTVKVLVQSLEASKKAIVAIEDTAQADTEEADPFDDAVQVAVFHVWGAVLSANPLTFTFRKHQIQGTRFGAAANQLRVKVLSLTASSNLKIHAWLEQ